MTDKDEWNWSKETVKAIIERILDNYEFDKKEVFGNDEFGQGARLAYDEIIDAFRSELSIRGYDFDEFMKD